jgi:hypothetical protein
VANQVGRPSRVGLRERPDGREDRPGGDEEQAARLDRRHDRGIEDERDGKHDSEPRERRVPGTGQELEDLASRQHRRDHDHRDDPRPAEQEGHDDGRDEHGRAGRAQPEHAGAGRRRAVQRPNLRVRLANSRSAASKASAPKSGHRTSVV